MRSDVEQLRAWIDPLTPLYLLVDPMVGEPIPGIDGIGPGADPAGAREQAWSRPVTLIELAKNVALPRHQHPYLVLLEGPDDPWLDLSLQIADEERLAAQSGGLDGEGRAAHRIGGWLQSSISSPMLAACLADLCRVNTAARTSATYLRLADRRVLDLLCHVVGTERVAGQFDRLQSWMYLDSTGVLRRIGPARLSGETIKLDVSQWHRLEQGEMIHQTLARFLGQQGGATDADAQALYSAAEKALEVAMCAAREFPHRFPTRADQVVWAALHLLHPSLMRSPAVYGLLNSPGTDEEPPEPVRYLHHEIVALALQSNANNTQN